MKKREKFKDDGRTLYSMDNVPSNGLNGRTPSTKSARSDITRKERRAIIGAAYRTYLPVLFGIILCFTIAYLLLYLWLL